MSKAHSFFRETIFGKPPATGFLKQDFENETKEDLK